jgi:acetyltransferase-like isoleucine patch superfamily enzyme
MRHRISQLRSLVRSVLRGELPGESRPSREIRALRLSDHAFVSGGTFARPRDLADAIRMTGNAEDGQLLIEIWHKFNEQGVVAPTARFGINARIINEHALRERVTIGEHSIVRGMLRQEREGRISIGKYVYIGDHSLINAAEEVTIGDHTLIAHNVNILDNDTHPSRRRGRARGALPPPPGGAYDYPVQDRVQPGAHWTPLLARPQHYGPQGCGDRG